MRNWIKLFEAETLMEKQDYAAMFNMLVRMLETDGASEDSGDGWGLNELRKEITSMISKAKAVLKRKDRIVWYLKIQRYWLADKWAPQKRMHEFERQYFQDFDTTPDRIAPEIGDLTTLEHYLSLPIPAIQDYDFTGKKPGVVSYAFIIAEDNWRAAQAENGVTQLPTDEIIIDFGNDWAWVNLHKAYCSDESNAMGHCGNSPRQNTTDTILSLRKLIEHDGERLWKPALTFILRDDGMLTEMKGRGNDKPAARYHEMILALLRLPIVEGIVGGGYMAENNFSLSDVDPQIVEALIREKPDLAPYDLFYRILFLSDPSEANAAILTRKVNDHIHEEVGGNQIEKIYTDTVLLQREKFRSWINSYDLDTRLILTIAYGDPEYIENEAFDADICISDTLIQLGMGKRDVDEQMGEWKRLHAELLKRATAKCRAAYPDTVGQFEMAFHHDYTIEITYPLTIFMQQLMTTPATLALSDRAQFQHAIKRGDWVDALFVDNMTNDNQLLNEIINGIYDTIRVAVIAWAKK